ncbi:MAG: murein biosynthesis integral membrane protein MurJ [Alphaproteobacteria bacterium]|nr:murein biosynthesis integral membrane protein MurJ [Alphaproteobacteria bacterium]
MYHEIKPAVSILKAVTTIGSYTGLSRILGLVREILLSHFLGAGLVADAFIVAFKFPNFFRRFFGEGAFNAAFVPVFAGELAEAGKESAKKIADDVFSFMTFFLTGFCLFVVIFTPLMIHVLAPGFATTPERLDLAVGFIRITFPYLLFISLTALLSGILNSLGKFANAAAAPILLNVVMIGALFLADILGYDIAYSLCTSVFIAGILQFAWLYTVCAKNDVRLRLHLPKMTPKVKQVFKLMGPGTLGAGVMQVNIFIDLMLASFLPTGALAYLYYADRLNQLPLSVFGIAISTALLPLLSKQLRMGEVSKAESTTRKSIEVALQLTMPAAVGLIILAGPIIDLIYGHGKFDQVAIDATAPALAAFAMGLPAYVVGKVLSTCFFARQDTKTPLKIAIFSVSVNLFFNLILIWTMKHVGLALSTSLSAWAGTGAMAYILHKRGWYSLYDSALIVFFTKVAVACALMAMALMGWQDIDFEPTSLTGEITLLLGEIIFAIIVYIAICHLFGLKTIMTLLRRKQGII